MKERSHPGQRPRPRRMPVRIPVTTSNLGMFFDSEIMNLSKGGVFLRSDITLPLGSQVDFEFRLPDSSRVIAATGVVVWARRAGIRRARSYTEHPPGMGIQFREIAPEDVDLLLDALDTLMKNS